jgi:hypothetical protein
MIKPHFGVMESQTGIDYAKYVDNFDSVREF